MIIKTAKGYIIQKTRNGEKFPLYLVGVRKGCENYTTDYLHARCYSLRTAQKHDKNIPEILNF